MRASSCTRTLLWWCSNRLTAKLWSCAGKLIQSGAWHQQLRADSLTSNVFSTYVTFCWLPLLIFSERVKLCVRRGDGHLRHITWPRVIVSPWDGRIKVTCQKFYSVVKGMAYRRCSFECSDRNTTTMTSDGLRPVEQTLTVYYIAKYVSCCSPDGSLEVLHCQRRVLLFTRW